MRQLHCRQTRCHDEIGSRIFDPSLRLVGCYNQTAYGQQLDLWCHSIAAMIRCKQTSIDPKVKGHGCHRQFGRVKGNRNSHKKQAN